MKIGNIILSLLLAGIFLAGCQSVRRAPKKSFRSMDSVSSVVLPYGQDAELKGASDLVEAAMSELENKFSLFNPTSEVARLNASAGLAPMPVSAETINVLLLAKYYYKMSDGAFDVTVGPLMRLWGFSAGKTPLQLPDKQQIEEVLKKIGTQHIIITETMAGIDRQGVQIDLSRIAKGYAVDVSCHRLLAHGFQNSLVNLGGIIRCLGDPGGQECWRVAVKNPFKPSENLGVLLLKNGHAVATAGNYKRFVTIGQHFYSDIIDPRSGSPVEGMASVTVISPSAAEADALSTALFVLGVEDGLRALRKTASPGAMFVLDKQPLEIWLTDGFAAQFIPEPALTNHIFRLAEEHAQ